MFAMALGCAGSICWGLGDGCVCGLGGVCGKVISVVLALHTLTRRHMGKKKEKGMERKENCDELNSDEVYQQVD